jgi:site-specific DNA recombinase
MRAAIYCRVSTVSQKEEGSSLETQAAACRAYAAERGWHVVGVYGEVHTADELFERAVLGRVREAVRNREVDVVLAHALDRLTRNQAHLGVLVSEADHAGVGIELVTERLEDTPEGRLLQAVRGFVAEVERIKIKERTVRGKQARVRSGRLLPGRAALYGYRWRGVDRSAYDVHPDAGPVIQRIFREVAEGATIRSVALRLTAEGTPTPTGGSRWSPSTLHTILKRRAYTGEAVAWMYATEKVKGGGQRVIVRPEHEQVNLPEGTIPRLVDDRVFEAVQLRLRRNREQAVRNNRNPEATLLRGGFARCGYCGTVLSATTKKGHVFYRHGTRTRDRHGCPSIHIKADRLDAEVWGRVEAILTRPKVIAAEVERMAAGDPAETDLVAIDRRLEAVARKQGNLVKRLALLDDEDTAELVAAEVNSLAAQKRQLEAERAEVEARGQARKATRDQLAGIEAWCRRVATNLQGLDYGQKRQLLEALAVRVQLYHTDHDPRYEVAASLPIDVDEGGQGGTGEGVVFTASAPSAGPAATCSKPTSTPSASGRSSTTASRSSSTSSSPTPRPRGAAGRSAPPSTPSSSARAAG